MFVTGENPEQQALFLSSLKSKTSEEGPLQKIKAKKRTPTGAFSHQILTAVVVVILVTMTRKNPS